MLDARIAFALKKIITNTYFKKKASLGEQKAQMPEVLVLQNSRMEHRKKPRNKNDAPAEKHGIWRNMSISSMTRTKPRSSHLHEVRSLPVPSLKRPEEREFVVDPGASMHVLNRTDLNSAELETKRVSRNPTTVITAKGQVQTVIRSRPEALRDGTNPRGHGCSPVVMQTLRHMSGPAVRNQIQPTVAK